MPDEEPVLKLASLRVRRSASFALEVPALALAAGQVTCVVGANGCGKTTLLEAVAGLAVAVGGSVTLLGQAMHTDSIPARRALGYVPDDDAWLIPELTAREYFDLLGAVYARAGVTHDTNEVAASLAENLLFHDFTQQLGSLSHGNKKKVQLIAGLLHRPRLLVVDELRNGLDPIAIVQAEQLLQRQKQAGTAILAATHDLWWAERFADHIIMIREGRILLQDNTSRIVAAAGSVEARFLELYGSIHA
jgi:ABC-2 type transport system ATP-binding protein